MIQRLYEFLRQAGRPTVCVVGDMMLDTYVWGRVSRISPEGPIPVLHAQERDNRPGGAGSVSAMLAALGADVVPVGVVGPDGAGRALRDEIERAGMDAAGLIEAPGRPTTTKTRYLGYVQSAGRGVQQLLRVDDEETDPVPSETAGAVVEAVERAMGSAAVLVVQDMGKGLLTGAMISEIIASARGRGKAAIVDPERAEDYAAYRGATCILPNRFETELITGIELRTEDDCRAAAAKLLAGLDLDAVIIKRDRDGIFLATSQGERTAIAAYVRDVADVTGAGDMVAAAVALSLAEGADLSVAAALANFAAGIEVSRHGAAVLRREEVLEALRAQLEPTARKIKTREEIRGIVAGLRSRGRRVAFTNGCFDLLHLGHVRLLAHARAQADVLVVGLNTDCSVRRLKGPGRPINSEQVRARVLASLGDVDYVVLFDEESVLPLIRQVRPDVLVKGGDYDKSGVVGADFVEGYGGEVDLAPLAEGFSTTDIIGRIANKTDGKEA